MIFPKQTWCIKVIQSAHGNASRKLGLRTSMQISDRRICEISRRSAAQEHKCTPINVLGLSTPNGKLPGKTHSITFKTQ